jgi:uncharacterized protein
MGTPTFRELTRDECAEVLRRNQYGRLAFTHDDRIDVEPIHYVLDAEWLYLRTSAGAKVATLLHEPWVAFEVDEVRGLFDWTSVVAKGTVYFIAGVPGADDPKALQSALAILRRIFPQTMTAQDPTPSRNVLLRVSINELHGRASRP